MKLITVFTPTYNRAYCLEQLYTSLVNQTNPNFIWLIIDDGSTDNTKELVELWIDENKIEIQYIYKENGGMHTAHNTAYANIKTEYNVCIDSDDYMPIDAIEIILNETKNLKEHHAGIIGLDADKSGKIIGTKIPERIKDCRLSDLYQNQGVKGDKKLVYRTDLIKKYPLYPIYKSEKFVPLGYLYYIIDNDYFLYPINKVLVIVEYQEDGSSKNIINQYRKNPRGFAFSRVQRILITSSYKEKIKNIIHLISCVLFSKEFSTLLKPKAILLIILLFPVGVLLNLYIRYKTINKI